MSIASSTSAVLPYLTQAQADLTRHIDVVNEHGVLEQASIPAERALTVYVDKREIVTLMTLGAHPELLVLGYLRNQRLVADVSEVNPSRWIGTRARMVQAWPQSKPDTALPILPRAPKSVWSPPAADKAVCLAT